MTTVILVSIGILLAAVAALSMFFWGGSAYNTSHDKADAARLVGDSVQIEAAMQAYRAQEGKMPGSGTGASDPTALQELISKKYLTSVPPGLKQGSSQDWKIDWNYGIARSTIGDATDATAMDICQQARQQLHLPGTPLRCDDSTISNKEPCCIMSGADASS